jgi:hypothetical protein
MSVSHNITTGHRDKWSCREPGVGPGIDYWSQVVPVLGPVQLLMVPVSDPLSLNSVAIHTAYIHMTIAY